MKMAIISMSRYLPLTLVYQLSCNRNEKKMSLSKFKLESWPVVVVVVVVFKLNSARPKTTPSSGRTKELNKGSPDFNSGLYV